MAKYITEIIDVNNQKRKKYITNWVNAGTKCTVFDSVTKNSEVLQIEDILKLYKSVIGFSKEGSDYVLVSFSANDIWLYEQLIFQGVDARLGVSPSSISHISNGIVFMVDTTIFNLIDFFGSGKFTDWNIDKQNRLHIATNYGTYYFTVLNPKFRYNITCAVLLKGV